MDSQISFLGSLEESECPKCSWLLNFLLPLLATGSGFPEEKEGHNFRKIIFWSMASKRGTRLQKDHCGYGGNLREGGGIRKRIWPLGEGQELREKDKDSGWGMDSRKGTWAQGEERDF